MNNGDALFIDLYELTMLQAYFNEGMADEAVFDLSVRSLPPGRNFLVACGLEQVLSYLEDLSFSAKSLEYLDSLNLFTTPFLEYLSEFRFQGDLRAVPEGSVVFPSEPLLEVSAPMPQAQLVETFLLNQLTFQTVIASKAARAVLAANGRTLVDFGSRRAHGSDAALNAARALYIAGYDSTSNVLAGKLYGIPVSGTQAHSYIEAHDSEIAAFRAFLATFPETVLLIDTYDTEAALKSLARLQSEDGDLRLRAVRLDSGDLASQSEMARAALDDAGLHSVHVFASGDLDEHQIEALLQANAPIDAFGVGTAAVVSSDAPTLDSVYKLASYNGKPRMKLSTAKATLPGKKQVFRRQNQGKVTGDVIALAGESLEGEPLLQAVMQSGRRTDLGRATLNQSRERTRRQLKSLPDRLLSLASPTHPYPVDVSPALEAERVKLRRQLTSN